MTEATAVLRYSVRPAVVARYLGQLALVQGALGLVPLAVALAQGEGRFAARLAVVVVLLVGAGLAAARLPPVSRLQTNEGLLVAALAFTLAPLLMVWPMTSERISTLDALFESVSGLTTTGLTTLEHVAGRSATFLFTRAWLQWIGGLGVAVLAVALVLGPHADARRLTGSDTPESILTTAHVYARRVLAVYAVLTAAGVLVLWAVTGDGFDAVLHILPAISTGGFSPYDESLAGMAHPGGPWVVTLWCLLGAVPLILYSRTVAGDPGALLRDAEVRALVVAVLTVCGLLVLAMHFRSGLPWAEALRHGAWLGASAQSTAGFSGLSVAALDPSSKLVLVVAMLVGAGVGSTGGGLKLLRLLVLLRLAQYTLQRTAMPAHAVAPPRLEGRALEAGDVERAAVALLLLLVVTLLSWAAFVAAGYPPIDGLLEVASAVSTVGLSSGITGPDLAPGLKLLLCLDMLMGRLEIVAMLVLVYPPTWIARRAEAA